MEVPAVRSDENAVPMVLEVAKTAVPMVPVVPIAEPEVVSGEVTCCAFTLSDVLDASGGGAQIVPNIL